MLRDFLGIDQTDPIEERSRVIRRPHTGRGKAWDPAEKGRFFGSFGKSKLSADEEVKQRLEDERSRGRELERTNPWGVRYYSLWVQNVLGDVGIRLIPRVFDTRADGKIVPDRDANRIIREGWKRWGKKGSPTVCGRHSWDSALRLLGVTEKRDGEAFVRFHRGGEFGPFGLQIQLFESDHVPVGLNRELTNGNEIRMGLERNPFDKVVAVWMNPRHPGAPRGQFQLDRFQRIPTDEVVHLFDAKRIAQSRGLPILEAGLTSMNMLQGYEEAELVAARLGASKMGWIMSDDADGYDGGEDAVYTDSAIHETLEPGEIGQLGLGQKFEGWDPTHPTSAFPAFLKSMLRRFAGVGGASYNSLANDLEGVNFSSLRDGKLTERDFWKLEQGHIIESVCEPVFDAWLESSLLGRELAPLPVAKLDKLSEHRWQGRRWAWVDPAKEATGHEKQIKNLTTTVSSITEDQGRELRELFEEISLERDLAKEYDVEDLLPYGEKTAPAGPPAPPAPPAPDKEDLEEELEDLEE